MTKPPNIQAQIILDILLSYQSGMLFLKNHLQVNAVLAIGLMMLRVISKNWGETQKVNQN